MGRCKQRADHGSCADSTFPSWICPVACGACAICSGHPLNDAYQSLMNHTNIPTRTRVVKPAPRRVGRPRRDKRTGRVQHLRNLFTHYDKLGKAAMLVNEWASRAEAQVRATSLLNQTHQFHGPRALEGLASFRSARSAFAERVLPQAACEHPILYLFSGVDLLTAAAFFPRAPAYVLVAALPAGEPGCLISHDGCSQTSRAAAVEHLRHWHEHDFAWTSTLHMQGLFRAPIGVLPALVLYARLLGHTVRRVRTVVRQLTPRQSASYSHPSTSLQQHGHAVLRPSQAKLLAFQRDQTFSACVPAGSIGDAMRSARPQRCCQENHHAVQ